MPPVSGADRAAAALAVFTAIGQAAITAGQLQKLAGADYGRALGAELTIPILDEAVVAGAAAVSALRRQDIEDDAPAVLLAPDLMAAVVDLPLREARAVFEAAFLARQLERANGNISRCARTIKMERSALHRKLKTLGVIGC